MPHVGALANLQQDHHTEKWPNLVYPSAVAPTSIWVILSGSSESLEYIEVQVLGLAWCNDVESAGT